MPPHSTPAIDAYVAALGGKRPIRKILIANNGIAAVKAIRSIRRWAYETFGDERAVLFVSMATPEDVAANAEYVRMADIWTSVPGGSNNRNFANVALIADIAVRFDCDAVWAGWGHASENPALPEALSKLRIVFLGPPKDSMHALGDKIASTIIAQSAGVPTVAWSGSNLTVNYAADGGVPSDIYQQACITDADHAQRVADEVGYPLVVKASEGGGGKGIRVVFDSSATCAAYRQVAGEVPGSPIFIMRLVQNARHLEVQIVADEYGDALALYGRDCSVQRRHQKIIEEGPVIAAPPHVWKGLERAAIALAKEVGYVGAGTVEYLYRGDQDSGEFYFLELNPRLQVEHPVTEWITSVNLPALQLHIGMGIPLRNVASIRKFLGLADRIPLNSEAIGGSFVPAAPLNSPVKLTPSAPQSDSGNDPLEPLSISPVPPHGHVIACRVTAENPDEGFQPTSGAIQELTFRNTPNVWGYFSVGASGGVHEFADSQFGHLFAWGETREASRRCLVLALKELSIRGDIRTTVEYLIKLLEMKAFRENTFNTSWLDSLIADKVVAEKPPTDIAVIIGAVCRAHLDFSERAESFTKCLGRGQLPPLDDSLVNFPIELIYDDVKYSFKVTRSDVSAYRVRLKGEREDSEGKSLLADIRSLADGAKLILANGRSHVCYAREEPSGLRLSIDGKTCLFPKEYDPTTLTSSVSGKLVRFLVETDDHVNIGQPYAELEVMKMYLTLSAPESGKITVVGTEGSSVEIGDVLARLELDDPSKVRRAETFKGSLPDFADPVARGLKPHQQYRTAFKEVQLLLRGFDARYSAMDDYLNSVDDARVCAGEIREALSPLLGRIPSSISNSIESEVVAMLKEAQVDEKSDIETHDGPSGCFSMKGSEMSIRSYWTKHIRAISSASQRIMAICQSIPETTELKDIASGFSSGTILASSASSLLDEYLGIEKLFARRSGAAADALFAMRDGKKDLSSIVEVAASHIRLKEKNNALLNFLDVLTRPAVATVLAEENAQTAEFKARLTQLSYLYAPEYADIALRARIILSDLRRPHFRQRKAAVAKVLNEVASRSSSNRGDPLEQIVSMSESILDVLVSFVLPSEPGSVSREVREIATEVQILRSYRAYEVEALTVNTRESTCSGGTVVANWRFRLSKKNGSTPSLPPSQANGVGATALSRGLTSFDSADNLSQAPGGASDKLEDEPYRHGILAAFDSCALMESEFDAIFEEQGAMISNDAKREVNVMTVVIRWGGAQDSMIDVTSPGTSDGKGFKDPLSSEAHVSQYLKDFCTAKDSRKQLAVRYGIKYMTFIVAPCQSSETVTYPGFYTFRRKNGFEEDTIYRHIDPPMAFQLELARLSNFSISRFAYPTRSIHVFYAQGKNSCREDSKLSSARRPPLAEGPRDGKEVEKPPAEKAVDEKHRPSRKKSSSRAERDVDARFFVRAVIRQADVFSNSSVISMPEAERTFVGALDAVEMANCDRRLGRTDFNHMFLNIVPPVQIEIDDVEAICRRMFQRYANRLWSLRVLAVEIKVHALVNPKNEGTAIVPLRFHLFNPSGHELKVESYVESTEPNSGLEKFISVSRDQQGSQHGALISQPYQVMDRIQRKRVVAQAMETTYVYDFLQIFNRQLQQIWRMYSEDRLLGGFHRHKTPTALIESTELVLPNGGRGASDLVAVKRQPGLNDVGVVVWRCTLRTPEYPAGREVVIIANDITFQSGSFGTEEDDLFYAASALAREEGIPRLYIAANSGARIGVAEEVRDKMIVEWVDPNSPAKGFKSLALHEKDLPSLSPYVRTGKKIGDSLVEITDIIGAEHGLGVENLMGSGLLAGEASRAYEETFTITYVCSRSVGIGAYLVRLGQRVIQKKTAAPIILTGYSALNKVLGHEVYISNEQLGGTKVMHPNGVTHSAVADDVEGVGAVLQWLSYVPERKGGALPITESRDPVSRPVAVRPPQNGQPYDPREMLIAGATQKFGDENRFFSGLFDKESWKEYLEGWAKTVIVGRARLGGVPTGIVAVETRSVECLKPADPASPETHETITMQAGQVWYPDSAAKTAQAIRDFDREGLPLFILANWRGFSGGMRDMFDEVLKTGSQIVDALRCYKQPVFVYIPPGGELRGGAWVVLDTLINPSMIEMYADRSAKGGVLEPEGTVDIKYRRRHIIKTMHRLDSKLEALDRELKGETSNGILTDERKKEIHEAVYAREVELVPVYRNVATAFCDLHDTPGRMEAKKAVRAVVDWENARSFFYWRLRRRLAEERVRKMCFDANPTLCDDEVTSLLKKWAASYHMERGMNGNTGRDSSGELAESEDVSASFDGDDRWVFHWLEVDEDAIANKIEKIRMSRISDSVSQSCSSSKEGFVNGIEAALRNCGSSAERAELVAAIQEKIGLATSSRSSSIGSSLSLLSRLGKLGWDRDGVEHGSTR